MSRSPTQSEKDPSYVQHPIFAAFYNWKASNASVRRMNDPLRRETAGRASGLVLEVGAGSGLNFPFYLSDRVDRVEAVDPDASMLVLARRKLRSTPVPIRLTQALVEKLPFSDDLFDSVVATLVFCSVADPVSGFREIKRVLKPGGTLLMFEHIRADVDLLARIQDVLDPLTTRLFLLGHCHWNRDTGRLLTEAGFCITHQRHVRGGVRPRVVVHATRG